VGGPPSFIAFVARFWLNAVRRAFACAAGIERLERSSRHGTDLAIINLI
jgi:hypothetical protein